MGRRHRYFSKEDIQMAQQTHEKMFIITYHQGNANETTMRYYLTPVTMAKIKNKQMFVRIWRKRNPLAPFGGNANWSKLVQTGTQKVKNRTTYDLAITTEYLPKNTKMFIATLFIVAKIWKQP